MRTVATILVIFLVRCVYLSPTEFIGDVLDNSCIFGPKSMSIILFDSANPEGKDIGKQIDCNVIDPSKPIVFLVHGFISSANTTNGYDLASKLVKKHYTVFSLDWSTAACKNGIPIVNLLEYPQAVENTRAIGKLMAEYVISLVQRCNNKTSLDNITFIGHSLGAHVSGFAAKIILNVTKSKVKTIIAADPAKPLFEHNKCKDRFCKRDANCTMVIHTSPLGISYEGNVNLEVNGGKEQPDCAAIDISCQHTKSLEYLIDMSDKCVYLSVKIEKLSFVEKIFGISKPPGSNTTDCIVVNDEIFNIKPGGKLNEGNYYTYIEKESPYCTQKSFSCNPLIIPAK